MKSKGVYLSSMNRGEGGTEESMGRKRGTCSQTGIFRVGEKRDVCF